MNTRTIKAFVQANAHCNMDSLPLRFGFYYPKDTIIDIAANSNDLPSNKPDRFMVEGSLENPHTGDKLSGKFVLTKEMRQGAYILVTVWRHDDDTEYYLSEVVRLLRKQRAIDPDWLVENHRLYLSGELRSHADLVRLLARKISSADLKDLNTKVAGLLGQLDELKEENQRLTSELKEAKSTGNALSYSGRTVLTEVYENVIYRGSSCTQLCMADGKDWYMKTKTFDPDYKVTEKAKTLIGKKVRVTSWDPLHQPGKWSNQAYFRNLYLDQV